MKNLFPAGYFSEFPALPPTKTCRLVPPPPPTAPSVPPSALTQKAKFIGKLRAPGSFPQHVPSHHATATRKSEFSTSPSLHGAEFAHSREGFQYPDWPKRAKRSCPSRGLKHLHNSSVLPSRARPSFKTPRRLNDHTTSPLARSRSPPQVKLTSSRHKLSENKSPQRSSLKSSRSRPRRRVSSSHRRVSFHLLSEKRSEISLHHTGTSTPFQSPDTSCGPFLPVAVSLESSSSFNSLPYHDIFATIKHWTPPLGKIMAVFTLI